MLMTAHAGGVADNTVGGGRARSRIIGRCSNTPTTCHRELTKRVEQSIPVVSLATANLATMMLNCAHATP